MNKPVIKKGQIVVANFGAMHPIQEYVVENEVFNGQHVHLRDDEGNGVIVAVENIRQPGERSVNGSPIGYNLV